ncbi:MAG: phospholipase D family protein [Candidatus Bathyarchaeota archaeon]|nr:phospholipase D family protein [Candidatus Bathyarchaeota archaeon]
MDGAKTWNDIRDLTGLSPESLNRALFEMYDVGILEKSKGIYRVGPEVHKEYEEFSAMQGISEKSDTRAVVQEIPVKFSEEKQKDLVRWINQWREVKSLDFSLEPKHFFLEGRHLDDISKELISKGKSEVLVVNPYVNHCGLSDTLREASKNGIKVRLITRPPDDEKYSYRKEKQEYHTTLKEEGVILIYNKKVHAKLIVVDRVAAIISSMNFYSGSSGGASWEAGLISVEETVVESIVNSILELLEKPESREMP